jgi:hypothetical protein
MATRKCVERRERTVTWGRRFVGSASVDTEGLRDAAVEENSTITPSRNVVKQFV